MVSLCLACTTSFSSAKALSAHRVSCSRRQHQNKILNSALEKRTRRLEAEHAAKIRKKQVELEGQVEAERQALRDIINEVRSSVILWTILYFTDWHLIGITGARYS